MTGSLMNFIKPSTVFFDSRPPPGPAIDSLVAVAVLVMVGATQDCASAGSVSRMVVMLIDLIFMIVLLLGIESVLKLE